jgi:hypothetical protein
VSNKRWLQNVLKKLMLVMIELLILIFLSVQAGDCAPISFYLSPPPMLPPYSLKLDYYGPLQQCLELGIESHCASIKSTWPFPDFEYEICISATFYHCLANNIHEVPSVISIIKNCVKTNCHPKLKIKASHRRSASYVSCLLECYEKHFMKPLDVIYAQKP